MVTDKQIEQYERDGYLLGERLLSDDQVETLRNEMQRVIDDADGPGLQPVSLVNLGGDEAAPVWQIVNIWQASEPFRELVFVPEVTEACARLARTTALRIWHDQIQYKPAAKGGVNMWHQDSPLWPVLEPKTAQVTAWIALDDVAEDNGCMSMVPGSHQWGPGMDELRKITAYDGLPETFAGHAVRREMRPVPKGHVHFHHPLTWHGSHANRSGRPRRAIALHYMTPETRYHAGAKHIMSKFVTVADGEPLVGSPFELVYDAAATSA